MSSTDKQLFSNNARSSLLTSLDAVSTTITLPVGQGARFPNPVQGTEFFIITLESAGVIEIVKAVARTGDVLTVVRAQEGTSAMAFPPGTQVQMRITKGALEGFARLTDRLADIQSVDNLPPTSESVANSFLCQSVDEAGNPIMAIKGAGRWRFPTHTLLQVNGTASQGTTTSLISSALPSLVFEKGRYIVNFLTGAAAGTSRLVVSNSESTIGWLTPLSAPIDTGVEFELLASNTFSMSKAASGAQAVEDHVAQADPHIQYLLKAERSINLTGAVSGTVVTDLTGDVNIEVAVTSTTKYVVRKTDFDAVPFDRYYATTSLSAKLPGPATYQLVEGDSVTFYKHPTATVTIIATGTAMITTSLGTDAIVTYDLEDEVVLVFNGTNWVV